MLRYSLLDIELIPVLIRYLPGSCSADRKPHENCPEPCSNRFGWADGNPAGCLQRWAGWRCRDRHCHRYVGDQRSPSFPYGRFRSKALSRSKPVCIGSDVLRNLPCASDRRCPGQQIAVPIWRARPGSSGVAHDPIYPLSRAEHCILLRRRGHADGGLLLGRPSTELAGASRGAFSRSSRDG